jgi:hypothetical protein
VLPRQLAGIRALGTRCPPVTIVTGVLGMQLRADAQGLGQTQMPTKYSTDTMRRSAVDYSSDLSLLSYQVSTPLGVTVSPSLDYSR